MIKLCEIQHPLTFCCICQKYDKYSSVRSGLHGSLLMIILDESSTLKKSWSLYNNE